MKLAVLSLALLAIAQGQAPPAPGAAQIASGTVTVLLNGIPVSTSGVLNFKFAPGVTVQASANATLNGIDINIAPDPAYMLSRAMDQAGTDHTVNAISYVNVGSTPTGLNFTANAMPALTTYTQGQVFIMTCDVTNVAAATLNLDGVGPVPLMKGSGGTIVPVTGGECVGANPKGTPPTPAVPIQLIAAGSPVSAFVILTPMASLSHSVTLTWSPSPTTGVTGYNVYRAPASGGPYLLPLNSMPINATSYTDSDVTAGMTYYYVATALDLSGESAYSNEAMAQVPG